MPPPSSDEEIERRLAELDAQIDSAFRAQAALPNAACLGLVLTVLVVVVIVVVVLGLSWLGVIK